MLLSQPLRTVFDSFDSNLKEGDALIIGVSGGPDSVFLLHALTLYRQKNPITIVVAHVNHGIRGKHANNDERFVKKLAHELQLKCVVKKVKLVGSGLEEKGRKVRRSFFEECAKKFSAQKIVTAHTLNDQLETVILNVTRGAFVGGMAAMAEREGLYYKPLLGVEKKDILKWLKTKKYSYCSDAMNDDESYARVLVRKKMVPLLRKINPSVAQTVHANAQQFESLQSFLITEVRTRLISCTPSLFNRNAPIKEIVLPRSFIQAQHPAMQSLMIQEVFGTMTKSTYQLSGSHVRALLALITPWCTGKKHQLPGVLCVFSKTQIQLTLGKKATNKS